MAKLNCKNEKAIRLIRIAIPIVLVIAGIVYAYGKLNSQVSTNKVTAIEALEKADANQDNIIRLQTDIGYIKEAVDRIEEKL